MQEVIDFILNIDTELQQAVQNNGIWVYIICFAIIFAETGLIVFGILPGDSLLFAAGSLAAGGAMEPLLVFTLLPLASLLGDQSNYAIGYGVGRKLFKKKLPFVSEKNLDRAEKFYERHGANTVIFGRYIPVIRTLIPFTGAVVGLKYGKFLKYSLIGASAWALTFLLLGYFFGQITFVKDNFWLVILVVVMISFVPGIIEFIKAKRSSGSNS